MATELPFEISLRIDQLGEPLAVHSVRSGWGLAGELIWSWEFFGTLVLAALAVLDRAGLFAFIGFKGPLLLIMLGIAVVRLVPRLRRSRDLRLYVFPTGLLRVQGETVAAFPWDEITDVRQHLPAMYSVKLQRTGTVNDPATAWLPATLGMSRWLLTAKAQPVVLRDAVGRELALEPIVTDFPDLIKRVQQETFRWLWPDARDRFDRGETLFFHTLRVSRAGIRGPKDLLPWPDLHEVAVKQGCLVITRKRRLLEWLRKPLTELSNLHVLLALIERAAEKCNPKGIRDTEPDDEEEE
jgi:hypothetical protein